jgi:thiamine transporter ThiT
MSPGRLVTRCLAWGALVGGILGALAGLIEGIALYPPSSWAGVALFLGALAANASAVLGVLVGCAVLLVRKLR